MDKTDLIMRENYENEYLPFRRAVEATKRRMNNLDSIRASLAEGQSVEHVADGIGRAWDISTDVVETAIRELLGQ